MRIAFNLVCQADDKYYELLDQQSNKESRIILKKLEFFKERVTQDYLFGELIKKRNLEKNRQLLNSFFQRYNREDLLDLDNCFCCDLTRTEWRMLYTIAKDEEKDTLYILCFMIVDHKTYEKYFT